MNLPVKGFKMLFYKGKDTDLMDCLNVFQSVFKKDLGS